MITLHHLENSRSLGLIWFLEEMGLDYDLQIHARNPETNLSPESYRKLHALGKAPVLQDGDLMLAEGGAIVEYLIDTYDKENTFRPAKKDTPEYRAYSYWMHASEGSLMPLIVLELFLGNMETRPPFFMRPIIKAVTGQLRKLYHTPTKETLFAYINSELEGRDWFAGDRITGADAMMAFPLQAASARSGLDARYPNVLAYLERLQARSAYQRAIEKGGALAVVGS